ncbi:helix-turn-helix domain-containing protein [Erythrobacteraceae bacterium E2-1 Yellow Sea]|nr:helix-turn-helix domain-containing protein [Erythrobacteraceae bacterium E2-1 Yellow Sea]
MEDHDSSQPNEELPLEGVGQRLRRAREDRGFALEDVAKETRIPLRHLEVIERGAFGELPARTYAVGFTRTYAKMLGLDDKALTDELRDELAHQGNIRSERRIAFEPGDPAKVPPSGLAWAAGIGGVLLVAGALAWFYTTTQTGTGPATLVPDAPAAAPPAAVTDVANSAAASGADGAGQVAFTALEDGVWVRFYDAAGNRLLEKQMASGERFEIPSDAQGPQIWTGRPDAFAITVDGKPVPKLAEDEVVVRDVAISAEALLARPAETMPPAAN